MKQNLPVSRNEIPFPRGRYIVSRTDLKGIITYGNDTFVAMSGFAREELIGKNHNIIRHPDMPAAAFRYLWDTLATGRPWRGIVKNRAKNGDFYWVDALVVPVRKEGGTVGYMSVRTEPARPQVEAAETLYRQLQASGAVLPLPSRWRRIPSRTRMMALVAVILAAQGTGAVVHWLAPALALAPEAVDAVLTGLGMLSVLAGVGLFYLLHRVFGDIDAVIGRIDHIAQGDLTDSIPLGRMDELGRLNDAVITMQTHLKAMMAEIAEAAERIGGDAERLEREMAVAHTASDAQSHATSQIAAAVEELVVSVREVAGGAQEAVAQVEASSGLLATATARIEDSGKAAQNVVGTVDAAGRVMSELFVSIHAIGEVTQAIKEISDQTNLLALNAAIEAARAGEQGRGFAVVADEVRKLAEKAKQQTDQISGTVRSIQMQTQEAVAGMEAAGGHVATTAGAVRDAQGSLDEVARHGAAVIARSRRIAASTGEQSATGETIARQVEDIVRGIEQTSGAVGEANRKAEGLKATAAALRRLIGHFRFMR